MNKQLSLIKLFSLIGIFAFGTVVLSSCEEDDPELDPIASFQFTISETNFLEVTFSNFSQNATTYLWDFGDGNTSDLENPVHTYAASGTYTVTLTATNGAGVSVDKTESVGIIDLELITGTTSKDWYLQREGIALGIGPAAGDTQWWNFGGSTPLSARPCILDDTYTFGQDGSFGFDSNGTLFIDAAGNGGWLDEAEPEACHDETETGIFTAADGTDVSAFASGGSYTFSVNPSTLTMTLNGEGAYIGLPNKTEAGDSYIPVSTKTFQIIKLVDGPVADSLQIAIEIANDGGFWSFYLVSYDDVANLPPVPMDPTANFSYTETGLSVDFADASANAESYSWDFGDGTMSTDASPMHTYSAAGCYTVTLTVAGFGATDEVTTDIVVGEVAGTFSPAVLSSATGKVWTLDGANSFYVGPAADDGSWWPGLNIAQAVSQGCMMDDEFIFFDDGSFHIDNQSETFLEDYHGGAFECGDPASLSSPYSNFASSTSHTFTADATTITVNGEGAYMGFSKPFNGGEYPGDASASVLQSSITYDVIDYSSNSCADILLIAVDIAGDGTAWWTIRLVSSK